MILIAPIYKEIDPVSSADKKKPLSERREKYPLKTWLEENNFSGISIDSDVKNLSLTLELKYEIKENTKGANQNDITLIAYAKQNGKPVVTLENRQQPQQSMPLYNYKIPLICEKENVTCIDLIALIKSLNIVL